MTQEKQAEVRYECRFAVFVEPPEQNAPDMHLIKTIKHDADGNRTPEVKLVYNYQRPFWIAKKGQRNYTQHKEWEDKDNLIEGKTSQSKLIPSIARALNMPWFKGNLKKLCESPYIYGAEILSTALIKKAYAERYPDLQTPFSVAVADVETDVIYGTKDITMMTVTYKDKVFTAVCKDFISGIANIEAKFREKMHKYIGHVIEARNITFDLVIVDNAAEVVRAAMSKAHEWKPDFLAFWNMDFDITKIIEACEKYGVDPKDIFSDPIVPKQYRYFRYKQGPSKKVTASGLVTPIKPAARWHTVYSTSSFYVIDAMCVYKHVRIGQPEKQSYALDAILKEEKLDQKLKFEEASHLTGLAWHEFMQANYKIEYMVYNVFDCIAIEQLDEKTKDMAFTMPLFSGYSDFENFKSQPRRSVDNLHFFVQTKGKVIGVTPQIAKSKNNGQDEEEDDVEDIESELLGLDGWIITLPAHLIMDNGLKCIEEFPNLHTNFHIHTGDLDVSAS